MVTSWSPSRDGGAVPAEQMLLRLADRRPVQYLAGFFAVLAARRGGRHRLGGRASGSASGRALPVRRPGRALAPIALAGLAVIGLAACGATPAGAAQTYRAHGVSFDYPARWREGSPSVAAGCCNGYQLWAAGVGLDWRDAIDVGANRSSPSITAANIGIAIPALVRIGRSFFGQAGGSLRTGPERITMGGMPGLRFRGSARVHGIAQDVTFVIAFNGTTNYWITCTHTPAKAAEVERACGQVVRTFRTSQVILAGGTRTYRAHGVSFDYPAGWVEGSPAVTSGSAPLWATVLGSGPAAWIDIRATRTGSILPITAGNIAMITPSVERAVRRQLAVTAGPERITIGGMPGLRFQGQAAVQGVPTEIALVIAFSGTNQYQLACGYTRATAGEVDRACAQVIRTFKVSKPR